MEFERREKAINTNSKTKIQIRDERPNKRWPIIGSIYIKIKSHASVTG